MLHVTSIYGALIALIFVALSQKVIRARRLGRVSMGDGGDLSLARRIRAQGNCAEYAPIALFLLALSEAQGTPVVVLHALGISLVAGRLLHGFGFGIDDLDMRARVGGMVLTLTPITVMALGLLGHALWQVVRV